MDSELWKQAKRIIDAAQEQPADLRLDFIRHACGGNAELERMAMAACFDESERTSFFRGPMPSTHKQAPLNDADDLIGRRIGPYRLIEELNRGGMGTVYLGLREDQELEMKVCVKLIHKGMATPKMMARFKRERQLLADLKHPHIAVLLDAGTTEDGRQYFIMEYIEGQNIDVWCLNNQPSLVKLLILFRAGVTAVDYAHGRGIIHRDIKPGNLMVTNEGVAKLLDFGIASMIEPRDTDDFTGSGIRPMTPEYASPEQRLGNKITPSSDIYALGLILFQLLTGLKPSQFRARSEEMIALLTTTGRPRFGQMKAIPSNTETAAETQGTSTQTVKTQTALHLQPAAGALQADSPNPFTCLTPSEREPVPEGLGHVLRRALDDDPAARYANTAELLRGIDRVLDSLPRKKSAVQPTGKTYDALFWFHPKDKDLVMDLVREVQADNELKFLLDEWLSSDKNPSLAMAGALDQVRCCLVCFGQDDQVPWWEDIPSRDCLALRAGEIRILPILLPGATFPTKQSELPSFLRGKAWSIFSDGIDEKGIRQLVAVLKDLPPDPAGFESGVCPFRGLEVFREQDRDFFFGRESLVQQIDAGLSQNAFLGVLGPSGSGKSSVVQAGLLPVLRARGHGIVMLSPTAHPLQELAFALADAFKQAGAKEPAEHLLQRMEGSFDALYFIIRELVTVACTERFYLVVDQFEEVFSLVDDARVRDRFIELLCRAVEHSEGQVAICLTMRTDFLSKCNVYPDLNSYLSDNFIQIGPMSREDLARAIESPARVAGLVLEPGLLDRILDDVVGSTGTLPLVEHAMLELYEQRREQVLTLAAYSRIGGIEGALARRAESEYERLDERARDTLRKMFVLCLIQPGEDTGDTRRHATKEELLAVGASQASVENLLNQWTQSRLLTGSTDAFRGRERVEIAHETLIRKWGRIGDWMREGRDTARLIQRLRHAARTWAEAGHDEDYLLRGTPLRQMVDLCEKESENLLAEELDFVAAGVEARDRESIERERARQHELDAARLRTRRTRQVAAAFLALVLCFTLFFMRQWRETAQAQDLAEAHAAEAEAQVKEGNYNLGIAFSEMAGMALAENKPHEAWLYAIKALSQEIPADKSLPEPMGHLLDPRMKAHKRLLWTSPAAPRVARVCFSGDGKLLAVGGRDHKIRLIDMSHGGQIAIFTDQKQTIEDLVFSPDSRFLASASVSGKVHLWDLSKEEYVGPIIEGKGAMLALAYSPDGSLLAAGSAEGNVLFWGSKREKSHYENFSLPPLVAGAGIIDLAFSPDSRQLAIAAETDHLLIWDRRVNTVDKVALSSEALIQFLGFENSTGYLVMGHDDGGLQRYDYKKDRMIKMAHRNGPVIAWSGTADLDLVASLSQKNTIQSGSLTQKSVHNLPSALENSDILELTLSPYGKILAVIGSDGWFWLLDAYSAEIIASPRGHSDEVHAADFSPDGALLATASRDHRVGIWDIATGTMNHLEGHTNQVFNVGFSPDGKLLASVSRDGTVRLWDPLSLKALAVLDDHTGPVRGVAFSSDGRLLATGSYDGTIRLWDVETQKAHRVLSSPSKVVAVDFSPDNSLLAAALADYSIQIWDLSINKEPTVLRGHKAEVLAVDFSPDGTLLASGSYDHTARLWNVQKGEPIRVLDGHSGGVFSVLFANDGEWLATGCDDNLARIWDLSSQSVIVLKGHSGRVDGLALSPESGFLATTSTDHTIRLWDIAEDKTSHIFQGHTLGVHGVAFSPDGTKLVSASGDHTIRLWEVESAKQLDVLKGHTSEVIEVAYAPDGRSLVSASIDGTTRLWNLVTGVSEVLEGESEPMVDVSFLLDGKLVAAASLNNTINLWDGVSGELLKVFKGHVADVQGIDFSPDRSLIASASSDQTVILWDVATALPIHKFRGHSLDVMDVKFFPTGDRLVTGSGDHSLRIWNINNASTITVLTGHTAPVTSVSVAPDGGLIASTSVDSTIRLWDVTLGREHAVLVDVTGETNRAVFSPDGGYLATTSDGKVIHLWSLNTAFISPKSIAAYDWYHEVFSRSLDLYGYRIDGFRVFPTTQMTIQEHGDYQFPQIRSKAHLNLARPTRLDYLTWLMQ